MRRRLVALQLVIGRPLLGLLAADRTPDALRRPLALLVVRTPATSERGLDLLDGPKLAKAAQNVRLRPLLRPPGHCNSAPYLIRDLLGEPELQPALVRHLRGCAPEPWSTVLYEVIVLDRAGGARVVAGALAVVGSLAGSLVPQHERAIFGRCVELLSIPPDPYSPAAGELTAAAREAAGALLAEDATLDDTAAEALATGGAPLLRAAVASAVKASGGEGPRRFLTYVRTLSPEPEALVRFAEDCDSRTAAAEPSLREVLVGPSAALRITARVRPVVRVVAPLCAGPALAVALGFALSALEGRLTAVTIDPSVAVGALAVLAAVHVLAVQLAATSSPGVVATSVVAPPLIVTGYGLGITMLVLTLLARANPTPAWHPATAAAILLVVVMASVVAGTVSALGATGQARAAEAAARRGRALATRSGRTFDRMRQQGVALDAAVGNTPYLRSHMSPDETAPRQALKAERAGYLAVHVVRLERLAEQRAWRDGELHLDVFTRPGRELSRGEEYAAIVPASRAAVSGAEFQRASAAFSVERHEDLERFTELSSALAEQVVRLARAGDLSSARRLMDSALTLLRLHLHEAGAEEAAAHPASPALIAVINRLLATITASDTEEVTQLCIDWVEELLRNAGKSDPVILLIDARAVPRGRPTLSQLSLLYAAAQRAIALSSDGDVALIQRTLHRLAAGSDTSARYANETAGRLVQYSAAADPLHSRRAWTRWLENTTAAPAADRTMITARIGAAAWRVGNLSLAAEAAVSLEPATDLEGLRERVHERDTADRENLVSRLYGRPLGHDAEQRLDEWITAAEAFRAGMPPPCSA